MKAETFVKLMRTIISEEVRRVVREELRLSLTENTTQKRDAVMEERPDFRSKYKDVFEFDEPKTKSKSTSTKGKDLPKSNNVMSLLMETAEDMKRDPSSQTFFEGLR